jgi:acetoin utilization deacetylase AcuC-like enzyme
VRLPLSRLRQLLRRPPPVEVWYDEAYRVPLPSLERAAGVEPRRVDFVVWYLLESRAIRPAQLRTPEPVRWEDLQRVHDPGWLESLQSPETLASIFAVDPSEVAVEPVLSFVRLAAGGTVAAARSVLRSGGTALNLAGGFHHAGRARGAGFCAVSDVAAAIARVRAEGFTGQVVVLDTDAHPPDGLAECLAGDLAAWIGSLTASRWTHSGPVDEVLLPEGTGDEGYLSALDGLLRRMPRPALAFVIAGGDVLAGDRLGGLSLTLAGARARDRRVHDALCGVPQVWLPGGGYHPDAWRVLAGAGLVLARRGRRRIPRAYEPLTRRFAHVSREMSFDALHGDWALTEHDLVGDLGHRPPPSPRLLGFYTPSGVEYGLFQLGILGHVRRLGYDPLRVEVDSPGGTGDRLRLFGGAEGEEHLLIEAVLERRRLGEAEVLFVNWLTLRNPRVRFSPERASLPGQDVPGLGLAREATLLLALIARRLGLEAVVLRPAWFHLARAAGPGFRFLDPERQGRFEALARDTVALPLAQVARAVAEGRARINGAPYAWEASDFAWRLIPSPPDPAWQARVEAEKKRVVFELG